MNVWRAEDNLIQVKGGKKASNGRPFNSGIVSTSDKIAGGRPSYPNSYGHVSSEALASGTKLSVTAWSPWKRQAWITEFPGTVTTGVMLDYECEVK